jgi:hypothetical protein
MKMMHETPINNKTVNSDLGAVSFQLFQELYGNYVQMDDRFESVHIWSEELALRNKGKWTPQLISKAKYEAEKLHSWNNCT